MLVGDTETRNENPASIWLWGFATLDRKIVALGYDVKTLVEYLEKTPEIYFFHNLKFDASFICDYLFDHKIPYKITMSEIGAVYMMEVYHCKIYDSYKFAKGGLRDLAKAYGLDVTKGDMEYNKPRPIGYRPDEAEMDYFRRDLFVLAGVVTLAMGVSPKKTLASRAYSYYVTLHPSEGFYYTLYPRLGGEQFKQLHLFYHGGIGFKKPLAELYRGNVSDWDVNSEYPFIFRNMDLPRGYPVRFKGEYQHSEMYPMFLQHIAASFCIKPDRVPFLYETDKGYFSTSLLTESKYMYDLYLTDIEMARFKADYDIFEIEYLGGFKFRKAPDEYRKQYVDHFYAEKKKWPDGSYNRQAAKDMLNSITGKFGAAPDRSAAVPYRNKDGALHYHYQKLEEKYRDALYIPSSIWITAYGRLLITSIANANYSRLLYIDTDAVHLIGPDLPLGIGVGKALGEVKLEKAAIDCRYFGTKSYALMIPASPWLWNYAEASQPIDYSARSTYKMTKQVGYIIIKMSGVNSPMIYDGSRLRGITALCDFDGKDKISIMSKKAKIVKGGTMIEDVLLEKRLR